MMLFGYTFNQIIKGSYYIVESIIKKLFTPKHIKEQVVMRTVLAKACVLNSYCLDCKCALFGIADKRYANVACDKYYKNRLDYCYGEFMNKKEWEEKKKLINFEFFETLSKQINKEARENRLSKYSTKGKFKKYWYALNEYFN